MRYGVAAGLLLLLVCVTTHAQPYEGYTLYNPMNSRTSRLITNSGSTINTWQFSYTTSSVPYLLKDSTLVRPAKVPNPPMRGGGTGGLIERVDWAGNPIWSYTHSEANRQQHHDIQPMPGGSVLLIAWQRKTRAEAVAMGRVSIYDEMWPTEIVEYDPETDSLIWEWYAWDHLIQDVDPGKPNHGVIAEHPELIDINLGFLGEEGSPPPPSADWIHANAIDYNEELDQIVFSSHHLHEILIIDHSTTTEEAAGHSGGNSGMGGDILYRWGNPQNYGRGDSEDQHFFVVHGVNWIDPGLPGEGNIISFNNGDRPGSENDYSSVDEIVPPVDSNGLYQIAPDSAFGPPEPVWSYSDPGTFYSNHLSGAHRLPNGNTLACEGTSGRLLEVTSDGQVVWQYNCGSQTTNALKYGPDYLGIQQEPTKIPVACGLDHVYPNPFARSTRIRYHLSTASEVTLTIHDAGGRVVATIANCVKGPGTHEAELHARGSTDTATLPAGIYFARLLVRSPARMETEKLVLTQ